MSTISAFTSRNLMAAVSELIEPFTPFQSWFFSRQELSSSEHVDLDKDNIALQMAAFVEPDATEKATEKKGWESQSFRIPYMKPLMTIEPKELVDRLPGEPVQNGDSFAQRMQKLAARSLADLEGRIQRRIEWMGAQLAINGTIPILDADGQTLRATIAFPRDPSTIVSTEKVWDSAADIVEDIESAQDTVEQLSGHSPDIYYCSSDVWSLIRNNDTIRSLLDNRSMDFGMLTSQAKELGIRYVGNLLGTPLYVVNVTYKRGNTSVKLVPDGHFGMGSMRANHSTLYGPIHDFNEAGDAIAALAPRYPTSWVTRNPAVRHLQMHTAPLPFTRNWDSFFTYTNITGGSESE